MQNFRECYEHKHHSPIQVSVSFKTPLLTTNSGCNKMKSEIIVKKNLNFNDENILSFYQTQIDSKIKMINEKFALSENAKSKLDLDELYLMLCNAILESENESLDFQESISIHNINQNSKCPQKKSWFTNELKDLKDRLSALNREIKYTNNSSEMKDRIGTEIKKLKREFRKKQRQNIFLLESQNLDKFEKIAREKNKNRFWRFVKINKKKRTLEKKISLSQDSLSKHYENFFSDSLNNPTAEQIRISTEVKEKYENYTIPNNISLFSMSDIEMIFKEIEPKHCKGHDKISYFLIKNANTDILKMFLLNFYNQFLKTNSIPSSLNISRINPILKDQKGKTDDINNIRPISISNCFAQIFEKLILLNSPNLEKTHKNQFGFKKKTSCNHAIFVLKETIFNYTQNKSSCKIASLDAEKAFDKVWRDGLFYKLIGKLNYSLWVILKKYYDSSTGSLSYEDNILEAFIINCGVKQGGILSPFLFNAFIDDLVTECTDMNIGALIGNLNTSIIVYADDILLISPIDSHLQRLLDICSKYGDLWRIKFNPKKSNIISFGGSVLTNQSFFLNINEITNSNEIKYLGIYINSKLDFDKTAMDKFKNVQRSIFSLSFLGLKPMGVSPFLQSFIYKTYCLSTFTYALETSTLKKETIDYLSVSQNNLIRQVIGLKARCHISKVLSVLKIFNFEELYVYSKLCFLNSIKNNFLSQEILKLIVQKKNTLFVEIEIICKRRDLFRKLF